MKTKERLLEILERIQLRTTTLKKIFRGEGVATVLLTDSLLFFPSVFSIILIMVSMFVTMVFMVNLLIAQLTSTYEKAYENAEINHDISKALFTSQLDNSRFPWLVSTNSLLFGYISTLDEVILS